MLKILLLIFSSVLVSPCFAKEKIFFISHAGAGDSFWSVGYQGFMKGGRDLNAHVHFLAPEAPNDISRQVELLDAAIAAKPDAIALTIPNALSFSRSLQKAHALKIPVIAVNSKPSFDDSKRNPFLSFIGMDDYQAGRKLAERAFASGRVSKRVVIANHQPGHSGLENRLKGIQDVLTDRKIHVDKLDISSDPSSITSILESHMNRYPDLSTVFCLGPECVHGIGRYFYEKKRKVYLASFDLSSFTLQLIKEGIVAFAIDQQPFEQGYRSVRELIAFLRDNRKPQDVDTGGAFVTNENVDSVFELVKKGLR